MPVADTRARNRRADARRGSARQRGYTTAWEKRRALFLARNPLCRLHYEQERRLVPATVVDHIVPHGGDMSLFWDEANWQSLCTACHNSRKQSEERLGYSREVDPATGWYRDPRHPANQSRR